MTNNNTNIHTAQDFDINCGCNSEYFSVQYRYSELLEWLYAIKEISGGKSDLESDIKRCRRFSLDEKHQRAIFLISEFIDCSASGQLIPFIDLFGLYNKVCSGEGETIYEK